jgi:hypothetical protein
LILPDNLPTGGESGSFLAESVDAVKTLQKKHKIYSQLEAYFEFACFTPVGKILQHLFSTN